MPAVRIGCFLLAASIFLVQNTHFLVAQGTNEDWAELQNRLHQKIQPILREKCGDCHSGAASNAGINLDSFQSIDSVLDLYPKWEKILDQIKTGNMPPVDSDPLLVSQKNQIARWSDQLHKQLDCSNPFDPGHVTIRRLNRNEYKNSIRDLLGVDFPLAENFPGDDVGYGFDNIADVLSLPPLLMEKYLDAAELISKKSIVDPHQHLLDVSLSGASFVPSKSSSHRRDGMLSMFAEDEAVKTVSFPEPGTYALVIRAFGDQSGNEAVKMTVTTDDRRIGTVEVLAKKRKPNWYAMALPIREAGPKKIRIRFDNDFYVRRAIGKQDRNLYVTDVHLRGPKIKQPTIDYLKFDSADRTEAEKFLKGFLPRAFRHPVPDSKIQSLLQLYDRTLNAGMTPFQGIQTVLQAVLLSPEFLYRVERPVEPDTIRNLDGFERATALSFFVWSSTPDDELLDLARSKELLKPDIWQQQLHRVFNDPKSSALVNNFASQWLNLHLLDHVQPDSRAFPNFQQEVLADMASETKLVLKNIFESNSSILNLLDCDFTFLNDRLAHHYGVNGVSGGQFRKILMVNLPGAQKRSGILTHASILTLTSNPDRTSPVKRGKWIMETILGEDPPPAPPNIAPLEDQSTLTGTLRQKMQQHRADPNCASCHETMDALGFALENYDAIGRFRWKDEGIEIDANSTLPDGTILNGATGLRQNLRSKYRDKFIRSFTEKLLTYALGRGLKYYDRCTVNSIVEQASQNEYRISEFLLAIVQSDPFLKRRGPVVQSKE